MATVVAPPLPWDWDALRSPAWHEARARKRAVRAELQRRRDAGLERRHAVKLARIHAACTVQPNGSVCCVVDPDYPSQCPSRFRSIDALDSPFVPESPGSTRMVRGELLSREEALAWLATLDRGAPTSAAPRVAAGGPVPLAAAATPLTGAPPHPATPPRPEPTPPTQTTPAPKPSRFEPTTSTQTTSLTRTPPPPDATPPTDPPPTDTPPTDPPPTDTPPTDTPPTDTMPTDTMPSRPEPRPVGEGTTPRKRRRLRRVRPGAATPLTGRRPLTESKLRARAIAESLSARRCDNAARAHRNRGSPPRTIE